MVLDNRCSGCMEMLPPECTVCPSCGYDNASGAVLTDMLPQGSIIAARYMVGRALRRTAFEVRYIAYDCAARRKVYIDEFFPAGVATRRTGEMQLLVSAGEERAMKAAIREGCIIGKRACRVGKISGFAAVLDVFEENGTVYTVLEQLGGAEMGRKNLGKAEPAAVTAMLRKLSTALSQLHSRGVYHAGISPDSILIDRLGEPIITGLGVAAAEFRRNALKTVNMDEDFAAPEANSALYGKLSARTDLYSLAALAAAMLSGKVPAAVEGGKPRLKLRGLSKAQLNCLGRALSMDSGRRQRSVEHFYEQFLGEPSLTKTAAYKTEVKRDTKSLVTGIIGILLLLAGILLFMLAPCQEIEAAEPEAVNTPQIESTAAPEESAAPEATPEPENTAEPEVTSEPEITPEPEVTPEIVSPPAEETSPEAGNTTKTDAGES